MQQGNRTGSHMLDRIVAVRPAVRAATVLYEETVKIVGSGHLKVEVVVSSVYAPVVVTKP